MNEVVRETLGEASGAKDARRPDHGIDLDSHVVFRKTIGYHRGIFQHEGHAVIRGGEIGGSIGPVMENDIFIVGLISGEGDGGIG